MSFPNSEPWKVPPDLAAAIGAFVVNVSHLESQMASLVPQLLRVSKKRWRKVIRGNMTLGRVTDMSLALLRETSAATEHVEEIARELGPLIRFRNELIHTAWIPVPLGPPKLTLFRFGEQEDREATTVVLEDVEAMTAKTAEVFRALHNVYWSLPETERGHVP